MIVYSDIGVVSIMKCLFRKVLFLVSLLVLAVFFFCAVSRSRHQIGNIIIEPGNSRIYVREYDKSFYGWDSYGVTYFFLPSYVDIDHLDYGSSDLRMYSMGGELLTEPSMNSVTDVLIDSPDGGKTQYKVCFYNSENLYTMELTLSGNGLEEVEHGVYSPASIRVISPTGDLSYASERIQIKGRGNTSWALSLKKPYTIKLPQSASIAGMGATDKWVLFANGFDSTKMLNKIAFDLSKELGVEYTMDSDWVDLYVNGEYIGNYILSHRPDIGSTGLDITDLQQINEPFFDGATTFDTGEEKGFDYYIPIDASKGGYLLEGDIVPYRMYEESSVAFTVGGMTWSVKSPDNASRNELEYISSFIEKVDKDVRNTSTEKQKIDIKTFCGKYLVDEILYNADSGVASLFYYKKPGEDRLFAGPAWDYDKACGQYRGRYRNYEVSVLDNESSLEWDRQLMKDEDYKKIVEETFMKDVDLLDSLINEQIPGQHDRIAASLVMDHARWNGLEIKHYDNIDNNYRYLLFFLYKRLNHMAQMYDLTVDFREPEIYTDTMHTLTFMYEDGHEESMKVKDGVQLYDSELPEPGEGYEGWYIESFDEKLTYYIPIFEDMTLMPGKNTEK